MRIINGKETPRFRVWLDPVELIFKQFLRHLCAMMAIRIRMGENRVSNSYVRFQNNLKDADWSRHLFALHHDGLKHESGNVMLFSYHGDQYDITYATVRRVVVR